MEYRDDIPVPESIRRIASVGDKELAWTFFVLFSRMEYALKRSGYLKSSDGDACTGWDKFAMKYSRTWPPAGAAADLADAITHLKKAPPLKQVVRAGKLNWSQAPVDGQAEASLQWLLTMVRRVRNNLFHGGKFPGWPVDDPIRDRVLLRHSISILTAALELDGDVRAHIDDKP